MPGGRPWQGSPKTGFTVICKKNIDTHLCVQQTSILETRRLLTITITRTTDLNRRPVAQCRQFQEDAKDASVSKCTWTLSALEALHNALYKFKTYLLTYLINPWGRIFTATTLSYVTFTNNIIIAITKCRRLAICDWLPYGQQTT